MEKDSLTKMFESEYFSLDMTIIYIDRYYEDKGICDYLTNKLYSYLNNDL
jgi:hypothetical protein